MIAIDTETFLIERCTPFPTVVCLSWATAERDAVLPHTSAAAFMRNKLGAWRERIVGHNFAYDAGVLAASYPDLLLALFDAYRAGRVTDTMIRQQLIDIATGRAMLEEEVRVHSLASLYQAIFDKPMGEPEDKTGPNAWRMRYSELYDVDFSDWPDKPIDYSRNDARCTYDIWAEQDKLAGHLLKDDAFQSYSAFCLSLISAQGMRSNAARVAQLKREQEAVLEHLRPELVTAGLVTPVMRGRGKDKVQVGWSKSTKRAQELIVAACEKLGIEPLMTENKKDKEDYVPKIAIDKAACHWCRDPLMLRRSAYGTAEKMVSTYWPALDAGITGPITSRFKLATTGRTTSSAPGRIGVGMNMQNAPRTVMRVVDGKLAPSPVGVRECFEPREGNIFLSGDMKTAELHALAQTQHDKLGRSRLGEVLNAGMDPHLFLACYVLGGDERDYEDVARRYAAGEALAVAARQDAKPANFGFWGAMGVPRFIHIQLKEGRHWDPERAKDVRAAWFEAFEGREYFDWCKEELGPDNKCMVQYPWSGRYRKVRGLSMIANGYFQALVADATKKALCEVVRQCYVGDGPLLGARAVNFIHDELILEIADEASTWQPKVDQFVKVMEDEFNELTPDYPTKVEPVLSYQLSKRAKSVWEEDRLVPWLP